MRLRRKTEVTTQARKIRDWLLIVWSCEEAAETHSTAAHFAFVWLFPLPLHRLTERLLEKKTPKIHIASPSFTLSPSNISGVIKILFASLSVKILD